MTTAVLRSSHSDLDPRFDEQYEAAFDRPPNDLRLLLGPDAAELLTVFFARSGGVAAAHREDWRRHGARRSD